MPYTVERQALCWYVIRILLDIDTRHTLPFSSRLDTYVGDRSANVISTTSDRNHAHGPYTSQPRALSIIWSVVFLAEDDYSATPIGAHQFGYQRYVSDFPAVAKRETEVDRPAYALLSYLWRLGFAGPNILTIVARVFPASTLRPQMSGRRRHGHDLRYRRVEVSVAV